MAIYVHDENSLTNLFFSELFYHNKIEELMGKIRWDKDITLFPFNESKIELHHQLNLSEFGKPYTIIVITDNDNKKHLFVIEAKLDTYEDACDSSAKEKFDITIPGSSSKINNQLTLRYRAFSLLANLGDYLSEEGRFIDDTSPYKGDKQRRCKKKATLEVLKEFSKTLAGFYLIAITNDKTSPFEHECTMPLFDEDINTSNLYKGLGSLNWDLCKEVFNNTESIFPSACERLFSTGPSTDNTEEDVHDEDDNDR